MTAAAAVAARVEEFLERQRTADRPEVWIHLRVADDLRAEASRVDAALAAGEVLPLAGRLVAVKDNIDVAGCPTTAADPEYSYLPEVDAPAVARLREQGAIVVGKTNLDQFATGLVGTRSPFGAVRHAEDPARISGGSSSGSAVAVALGLVDLALGTDTAGSGRVPAALHGLWGIKPTRGLVPATGVVPACASLDCVTVFSADLSLARDAACAMEGADGVDPLASRVRPAVPPRIGRRLVVPARADLDGMADGWLEQFDAVVAAAAAAGYEIVERSIEPLLEAARMLYESSFVAERYAAVGEHISRRTESGSEGLDPTVASIVLAGADHSAAQLFADQRRLEAFRMQARTILDDAAAVLTPTTTWHPTIAEVQADPVVANSRMGRFTNFANLMDMAAVAFPAGRVAGLPFGAMLTGPAFADEALAGIASRIAASLGGAPAGDEAVVAEASQGVDLFVVGAHRSGQVLNHELVERGGALVSEARTDVAYRLHVLNTVPAKPGLVRVQSGGVPVVGEVWNLPVDGFGDFVDAVPAPMAIGTVTLEDGREIAGFLCEPFALEGAEDISATGDWIAWLSGR